jgi:hypothetical protein
LPETKQLSVEKITKVFEDAAAGRSVSMSHPVAATR